MIRLLKVLDDFDQLGRKEDLASLTFDDITRPERKPGRKKSASLDKAQPASRLHQHPAHVGAEVLKAVEGHAEIALDRRQMVQQNTIKGVGICGLWLTAGFGTQD